MSSAGNSGKAMDEEGKATAAMLEEIRMLINSGPQASPLLKPPRKDDPNSFDKNPLGQVPAVVKSIQQKQARRAKIQAKITAANSAANSVPSTIPGGKKITHSELLDHLLAQPIGTQHGYSEEAMQVKVVTAPYVDTIVNVEQRLWMEEYLQKQRDAALLSPATPGAAAAGKGSSSSSSSSSSSKHGRSPSGADGRSGSPTGVPEKKESKAEQSRRKTQEALVAAGLQEAPPPLPEPTPTLPIKAEPRHSIGQGKNRIMLSDSQVQIRTDNAALIEKYKRRYPRLLTAIGLAPGMNFDPIATEEQALGNKEVEKGAVMDLSSLPYRSDNWLVKFMEECYDEATLFIEKKGVSDNRRRKRCGLDLGALDAFPLVVERCISRTYSTLELRYVLTLEILATLDHIAMLAQLATTASALSDPKSKRKQTSRNPIQTQEIALNVHNINPLISIDGGRTALFAKFLAEELDVDYLAMFLLSRERMQKCCGIAFRDLNPVMLNEVKHAYPDPPAGLLTANAFDSRQSDLALVPPPPKSTMHRSVHGVTFLGIAEGVGSKTKVIPVELPHHMDFIPDVTMPKTNLVSIAFERLPWLIEKVASGCTVAQRSYFVDKVAEMSDAQLVGSNKRLEMMLPLHTQLPHSCTVNGTGICINGTRTVSIYNLLLVVCEQWKMVPPETKGSFGASGSTSSNLTTLNTFHNNDNELLKGMKLKMKLVNQEINAVSASLMKSDKRKRRIERKWKHGLTTEEELVELGEVRVSMVEQEADKEGLQSKLDGLTVRYNALQATSDSLWLAAASASEISAAPGGGKSGKSVADDGSMTSLAASTWRQDVTHNLLSALTYNHENILAIAENKTAMEKMGDVIVQTAIQMQQELQAKLDLVPKEPSLDDLVKSIEAEALALAKVGHQEIHALGMLPPPAPFISTYTTQAIRKEIRELQLAQEREAQLGERESMHREEIHKKTADEYLKYITEHNRRVKLLAEQREREAQRAAILSVAMSEIAACMSSALQALAQEVHEKRLAEIALEEEKRMLEYAGVLDAQVQLQLQQEIHIVVESSLALGLQRAQADLVEKQRLVEQEEERERRHLLLIQQQKEAEEALIAAKALRAEQMRIRILETSHLATQSVLNSLEFAVIAVTNVTLAEMWQKEVKRQAELELEAARLAEIQAKEAEMKHQKIRKTVVSGMGAVVGQDLVTQATKSVEIYFVQIEIEKQRLAAQLVREKEESLTLAAFASLMNMSSVFEPGTRLPVDVESPTAYWTEHDALFDSTPVSAVSHAPAPFLEEMWRECLDLYISEECEKQEMAVKRAKEEAIRAAKALKNLQYRISRTSRALIKIALETGSAQAHGVLTHPDLLLDLDPNTWLSEETLMEVEECYLIANMVRERKYKLAIFRALSKSRKVRLLHAHFAQKETFKILLIHLTGRRALHEGARQLTKFIRKYAKALSTYNFNQKLEVKNTLGVAFSDKNRLIRLTKMIKWWKYWAHVEAGAQRVHFNVCEREYMKAWMTWKYKYRLRCEWHAREHSRKNKAMFKIICMLKHVMYRKRMFRKMMHLRITQCYRRYIAKKRLFAQVQFRRARYDLINYLGYRQKIYVFQHRVKEWKRIKSKADFFHHIHMFLLRKFVRRRFRAWKFGARDRTKKCAAASLKLQSATRMWIIKRYVLNYYRWRRGLVCFQSHVRRKACDAWFIHNIHLYRSARCIQRNWRGWFLRSHHEDKRIMDLHFAAGSNNYEKLLYYVQRYPELLSELDRFGNTALHNAAKNAARRTLKLLLKAKLNPNVLNLAGLSPLHMIITSKAINRDDCCLYMLENAHRLGFDEAQKTPDGRTCLHLAVEQGRFKIVQCLLDMGLPVNLPDERGCTPLQLSFAAGVYPVTSILIDRGADVNMPGYCGTYPLHDCITTGDIAYPNLLINHGAYVNVVEPFHKQTPLHWACKAGLPEYVHLFVMQGAHILAQDMHGWTAAHHAAANGMPELYDPLREGDADFDFPDVLGKSPLHIAAEYGMTEFGKNLLLGCADIHMQDHEGNQPSHIAARDNKLETLQLLCTYDKHIGRVNYHHQTPLGLAKFYNSKECQAFLEKHYRYVQAEVGRNEVGDLWWDREVDDVAGAWVVRVDELNHRWYENLDTGETSLAPPTYSHKAVSKFSINAELTVKRAVVMVGGEHENTMTRHGYLGEWDATKLDIDGMVKLHDAATTMQKLVRKKLASNERKFRVKVKKNKRVLAIFIKRHLSGFMSWKFTERERAFSVLQAKFKGDRFRRQWKKVGPPLGPLGEPLWKNGYKHDHIKDIFAYINFLKNLKQYHTQGFYEERSYPYGLFIWRTRHVKTLYLSRVVKNAWCSYRYKKNVARLEMVARQPKTERQWLELVKAARYVHRTVGVYSEYLHPDYPQFHLYFYKHNLSNHFQLSKPLKLIVQDERTWIDQNETRQYGCTLKQMAGITKIQALYRGYKIRSYYVAVEAAMLISDNAEKQYMTYPDVDASLYNYALHCMCVTQDFKRARQLFAEGLRRMEYRGPDVAFLLYSYAIFSFVTHSLDYSDITELLHRARIAEEVREQQYRAAHGEEPSQAIQNGTYVHGKVYALANIGFYRKFANEKANSIGWHLYATCRFLVYGDFAGSFDAFLESFRYAVDDKTLKANFDQMMRHFHGYDKRKLESIVTERMRYLADVAVKIENEKTVVRETARFRHKSAKRIQGWYRTCLNQRGLRLFLQAIRKLKAKKATG